jgi:hypothetical protein
LECDEVKRINVGLIFERAYRYRPNKAGDRTKALQDVMHAAGQPFPHFYQARKWVQRQRIPSVWLPPLLWSLGCFGANPFDFIEDAAWTPPLKRGRPPKNKRSPDIVSPSGEPEATLAPEREPQAGNNPAP